MIIEKEKEAHFWHNWILVVPLSLLPLAFVFRQTKSSSFSDSHASISLSVSSVRLDREEDRKESKKTVRKREKQKGVHK